MIFRLLRGALRLHPTRLALVVLSTAMGTAIAAALVAVALQVEDRMARELRGYGANIVVEPLVVAAPQGARASPAWLAEADLPRVLAIFWRHNLVGIAPSLSTPANVRGPARAERALLTGLWFDVLLQRPGGEGTLRAGVVSLFPFWELDGAWPAPGDAEMAVLGRALSERIGARIGDPLELEVGAERRVLRVGGILRSGGFEEEQVFVNLATAQGLLGRPGAISRAIVSAVTVPLDGFGRKDPAGMTRLEYEKWFCTPYVTSVAKQVEEAIPGSRARPVWSLAEAEARVLSRLDVLMTLLAALALATAALAVASTFAARVVGRRTEIALMRAAGASRSQVALLLGVEIAALALAGGLLGAGLAAILVHWLGEAVFGTPLTSSAALLPLSLAGSLAVAALGAIWPVRRALGLDPAGQLKEAA
jgi:putative ABC transport system permease protein